ncbi:MAG: valine--tRNA ligase [Phycisphaeraceae bacterium]|nr:valine--tRNA ligase [Phycisphaeraceae bacterium]
MPDPAIPTSSAHGAPSARAELPKQYKPTDHEPRIRQKWEASGAFHPDPSRVLRGEAKPYCIVIPPPNVTDRLHLGHALNNTLQDVLIRAHRMMGYETLWMPGTDHAGIATQAVVEKRLRKEGKLKGPLRESMRREEFVAIVQSFKDEYEATITGQLKAMGCSCDWQRQRFTMDEQCATAVYEAFFRLFRDGLIYRGKRLVNWDPVLQTAVADDECYEEEIDAQFYYLRYPLVHSSLPGGTPLRGVSAHASERRATQDAVPVTWSELRARGWPSNIAPEDADHADDKQAWVTVATTRPETYLGDTAVAINPRDPRAKALRGLSVELPLIGRIIPVIEDDYVVLPAAMQDDPDDAAKDPKAKYATGFLKVTPAHDPNDYEIGVRHNLPHINIFAPDATISDKHGWSDPTELKGGHKLLGLKRDDARKLVIKEFEAHTVGGEGTTPLFAKSVPYRHSVKHSDRSKAVIEPYLSDQWYVKVTDDRLRGSALAAMNPEQRTHASTSNGTANITERKPTTAYGPASTPAASTGDLTFYPSRYAKTFETWHENIRDWCISRQLWWGHQIPVWSCTDAPQDCLDWLRLVAGETCYLTRVDNSTFVCLRRQPELDGDALLIQRRIELCGFRRDPDVLDTWFSSALWPISTMGWPKETELLRAFNPSSTLCTAREIITLWVSRMVMFNRYFRGQDLAASGGLPLRGGRNGPVREAVSHTSSGGSRSDAATQGEFVPGPLPFRDVFIHALIMDGDGQKMSKSLGNGVDPLDIIESHGADAMRFVLCQMTTQTQDVRMPVQKGPNGKNTSPKFDIGRNFCNKLWNASRFALTMLEGSQAASRRSTETTKKSLVDRWMLSRLAAAVEQINTALANYEYSDYATALYDLMWRDFCDWYIEAVKPTISTSTYQRAVLAHTLESIVRLLHPITPFITEALWERLKDIETQPIPGVELSPARIAGTLATAGWPRVEASLRDAEAESQFERLRSLVTAIREVRAQHNVPPKRRITLHTPTSFSPEESALIETLAGVESITTQIAPADSAPFIHEGLELRVSNLADAVDSAAERARLEKAIADADKAIATLQGRLNNPGYAQKAPPAMVEQTKSQLAKAQADRESAKAALARL